MSVLYTRDSVYRPSGAGTYRDDRSYRVKAGDSLLKPANTQDRNMGMDLMTDWQPDVMFADPSTPPGLRIMLQARYQHLVLKFTVPVVSDSGLYEASWIRGTAKADTEEELLRIVCEELQDCGTARHDWKTVSELRDPNNEDNILRTQQLECTYCDTRERVITVYNPRGLPAPARPEPSHHPCTLAKVHNS